MRTQQVAASRWCKPRDHVRVHGRSCNPRQQQFSVQHGRSPHHTHCASCRFYADTCATIPGTPPCCPRIVAYPHVLRKLQCTTTAAHLQTQHVHMRVCLRLCSGWRIMMRPAMNPHIVTTQWRLEHAAVRIHSCSCTTPAARNHIQHQPSQRVHCYHLVNPQGGAPQHTLSTTVEWFACTTTPDRPQPIIDKQPSSCTHNTYTSHHHHQPQQQRRLLFHASY